MLFTSERPPIIRLNLGVLPWPDIATKKPYISIVEETGSGTAITITGSREFVNIQGTPVWYWSAADKVTIPDVNTNWVYYVTRGSGGEIVAEGTIEVYPKNFFGKTAIVKADIMCAGAIEVAPSVGTSKTYPVRFAAYGQDGTALELDAVTITATWNNPLGVPSVGESNPYHTAMTKNADNSYQFDWVVPYTVQPNQVTLAISVTYAENTIVYHKFVEIFRRSDFNPIRAGSGVVI